VLDKVGTEGSNQRREGSKVKKVYKRKKEKKKRKKS
jgi:hypothetical protein